MLYMSRNELLYEKVSQFDTPQSTTGLSPAEMSFGRRLRSHLDLLMPSVATRVQANLQ